MSWQQNKMAGVAGVGLIIVAIVIVAVSRPGPAADVNDNDTSVPVKMLCLACGATVEFSQEEFDKSMSAQAAAKCPKCGKSTLWMPETCPKCGALFVPESQTHPERFEEKPMPDGSMRAGKLFRDQACPKCGFKPYQTGNIPTK